MACAAPAELDSLVAPAPASVVGAFVTVVDAETPEVNGTLLARGSSWEGRGCGAWVGYG
jgi:hypothetical protein